MKRVLLLHGIWSVDAFLRPLARCLTPSFSTEIFTYSSVFQPSHATKTALRRCLEHTQVDYIVGHSLGGVLALQVLQEYPHLQDQVQRVVCLGSPLKGSTVVRQLERRGARRLVGCSHDVLHQGCAPWTGRTEVAVIAGNKARGLGTLIARIEEDSDGTVGVSETHLEGIAHHRVVPASHSGLLWCPQTADLTSHFLRFGSFPQSL